MNSVTSIPGQATSGAAVLQADGAPPLVAPVPETTRTRLFILRGDDRSGLERQVQALLHHLASDMHMSLQQLVETLRGPILPGGCRLAVIAGAPAELRSRLQRAQQRLADPGCRQINDRQGLYFTSEPLYPGGKLAVLFTGEGAQYPGMLADLRAHYPETARHFDLCDRLSVAAGRRREPISRLFLPSPRASAAERAAAEKELWRLDNAVGSVLMTNWGVYHALRRLELPADVFAGHSAGEISALAGAGCIEADEFLFAQLFELGHVLRCQEDDGQVAETVLLAVGAGRATTADIGQRFGPDVHVAMDNCPHQTVLAGPAEVMAAVEAELRGRGVVCDRLPFRRPYHTHLFEPHLSPIARMFDRLTVRAPARPVYSCVTTRPFPADPESIRRLAVTHWAARVEFTRLIESMYADGVRLFVESGPRGNLTSFVEDILRGRPCLAVAADLPRRSGLTQLQHLAGQLVVHHVPLRLEGLEPTPPSQVPVELKSNGRRNPAQAALLTQYLGVMEQFLDLQRAVTEQFLNRRPSGIDAPQHPLPTPRRFPLLGDILRHEPGCELLMRRRMDLKEDLYALDHTLGGRDASAVDPDLHGLPVMPMAFSIEMMAEAAAFLVPGKQVIGLRKVRLHRWIPLDEDVPTILEVSARVSATDAAQVQVEIRDLGSTTETLAVDGTVLLDDRYPTPPAAEEFLLTREGPCCYTPSQLYEGERRLFHGRLFQAVCSTDRQGEEGIEGQLRTLPHSGLFRSTPTPDLLTDPLLIDASTHILGCWHLGLADQSGRVVFPYELGSVQLYGPPPAVGTRIKCRVRIERSSARQVSHRIDLIAPDGRLWCQLHPAEYWRFYWPAEYTDYFRRKQEFLLGSRWAAVESLGGRGASEGEICCLRLRPPADLVQPVKRAALAHVSLGRAEWQQFRTLPGPDARKTEWLFGRIAAKDAVRALWYARHGERLFPADIAIEPDLHGRPIARRLDRTDSEELPAVSISHSSEVIAALAAFGQRVGIDLERVQPRAAGFEEIAFDAHERELLERFGPARDEGIARFWCAREAVAKALGRGQIEGPRSLAVRQYRSGGVGIKLGPLLAAQFPERANQLLIAITLREGDLVVAACFLERTTT
jgi:malonyl CoA-acyl carrier protein transacylase/phosphopantetheinyl transferase